MSVQVSSKKKRAEAKDALARGQAALGAGDLAIAGQLLSRAAQLVPTWAEPRESLAIALFRQGRTAESMSVLFTCLGLRPVPVSSVRLLCTVLTHHPVRAIQGVRLEDLAAALALDEIEAQPLVRLALRLLGQSGGALARALGTGRERSWEAAAADYLAEVLASGRKPGPEDELFHHCLARGYVEDAGVELLLTALRRRLVLEEDNAVLDAPGPLALLAAMARQCRRNEFVWSAEDDESAAARARIDLDGLLGGGRAEGIALLLRALYSPVEHVFGDDTPAGALRAIRPREAGAFASEAVAEWHGIGAKAAAIPTVGAIDDDVSRAVAAQYQQYPYPRWVEINPVAPGALRQIVAAMLPEGRWPFPDRNENVLVAGCGTGREAIATYVGFGRTANVTAIDLSRQSLGYAALKAEQYGAEAIDFIQMDILNLPELGRRFDIIQSSGVLHHMNDPLAGWYTLCRHLNPGGLFHVALYSAAARESLDRIPVTAPVRGAASDAEIRASRRVVLEQLAAGDSSEQRYWIPFDFWGLSACRDLLFHAREHRFTPRTIAAALETLDLEFLGFTLTREEAALIESRAPGLSRDTDLERWWAYEQDYPGTFAAMYDFWCRKPAARAGGAT